MPHLRRLVATLVCAPLLVGGLAAEAPAAAAGDVVKVRLHRAIKQLDVAGETRRGYDRDKFRHWVDADGDCRDTRDEVLAQESKVGVRGCDVQVGRWRSSYDRVTVRHSTNLDIDHLVALAEAWDSGAKRWNAGTRERFANDLGDRRSLVAVTASSNRSKSDRDPAEWMPRFGKCGYVRQWVAVKIRWQLTVDRREKRALTRRASHCRNAVLRVRTAPVRT
ncbi:MAG TPA: HNH endonuclease family protein, partial [Nocardioidaceae bacterium]|nr:HNH endonuclease family protein [Nocardioidaceae bacterium]